MAESSSGPGLNDLMSLFGGNPLSMIGKSITQFQSGITSFLQSIENFNETMEQMNGVARRINTMLDDLEPVVKAAVPQLTRTLRAADEMVEQMSIPIERVAPGLMRLAETLSSPNISTN
jgi:methyl-accepting chemotaxis protein